MIMTCRALAILALGSLGTLALTSAATPNSTLKVGIVNFKTCFEGSKFGKQEQAHFDDVKKQIETTIEAKEKELNELSSKFSDEYLDTLSPEAEAELKGKYQQLAQDLSQHQNQYYNMLQQANYQIVREVGEAIGEAAKKVAAAKGLDLTLNEEICFSHNAALEISKEVIVEMDAAFAKKQAESNKK